MGLFINRRTVITFEKLERSFYSLPGSAPLLAHCEQCHTDVSWLTPVQVVALTGLTLREIFRLVEESRTIHFNETPSGLLHVCSHSLELNAREIEK